MVNKRFFVEGLAQASYLFGSAGQAAVVDPKRDVDDYIQAAKAEGLRIVAILETHPHADFASGHVELAQRTGAKIYVSSRAGASYEHVGVDDGDRIQVGDLEVEVLATPGHSPDSLSFLITANGKPIAVFTGDTLFVRDVGRPDLRDADERPEVLANALYDSLFGKLGTLAHGVTVFPSHGAGSLCGRNISSAASTTIGEELSSNWAFQERDRTKFVSKMLANLPSRPRYFSNEVALNLQGLPPLGSIKAARKLTEAEATAEAKAGTLVIDARAPSEFGAGHFPGSINIGLGSALFSTWVGFLGTQEQELILIVNTEAELARARLELARIGFDKVTGYLLAGDVKTRATLDQLSASSLRDELARPDAPVVLDVRTPPEWQRYHIAGAEHIPLPELLRTPPVEKKNVSIAVICGSGYRSSIASSFLQAKGFEKIQNVSGGMAAFEEAEATDWKASDLVFLAENI